MCAIIGSFSKDKLIELIDLNSYRGSHSYSFSRLHLHGDLHVFNKGMGTFDKALLDILDEGDYGIIHIQAPTTEARDFDSVHPAREWFTALWHNGIIKANYVKEMQARFGNDTEWDTQLLLRAVNTSRDEINNVDGSFSCLWYDGAGAYLFRNDISPMFYDDQLNISSTKFNGSIPTPPNKFLYMDLETRALYNRGEFKTVENPYYFGDDLA